MGCVMSDCFGLSGIFLAFITPHDFLIRFGFIFFSSVFDGSLVCNRIFLRRQRQPQFGAGGSGGYDVRLYPNGHLRTKIWLLGNRQDELYVERIKQDLLPRLKPGKKYRLTTLGGLYGREKFAGISTVYSLRTYERDRELFRAPMYVSVMFSSGFFYRSQRVPFGVMQCILVVEYFTG